MKILNIKFFLCTNYWGTPRPSDKTIPRIVPLDTLDALFLVDDDLIELAQEGYALLQKIMNE